VCCSTVAHNPIGEHSSEFVAVVLSSTPAFATLKIEPSQVFAIGGHRYTALVLCAVLPYGVPNTNDLQQRKWNTSHVNETVTELTDVFNAT
jgi:hypothetical protein